ncbi:uncharacterized protein LOC126830664 isoform X1 [Patella vulgata]|uniref:uncharacterized protein LOC126830664 isoform X1 n=1 Tax=Patella vulgata TaxID=6465 RepID=UPI002180374E|nr:uncharacterized protein LOC126830664 isoform X1 [Patella vulgata]
MSYVDIESFWKEHQHSLKQIRSKLGKNRPTKVRVGSGSSTRSNPRYTHKNTSYNTGKPILNNQNGLKQRRDVPLKVRIASGSSTRSTPSEIENVPLRKSALTPPISSRKYSPAHSHPPFGKYRKSPPAHLSRLESPNTAEVNNGRKLRGNKFDVVPPVKPKKAFERKVDYDSWGDDSGNESDDEQVHYMPQPHPVAFYPPPTVVYGAPFPVYYPPPPKGARGNRRGQKKKSDRGYKDMYRDRRSYNSKRKSKSKPPRSPLRSPLVTRRSVPRKRNDDSFDTPSASCPSCVTDLSDDEKPRYQYIFAGHNTYDPYGEEMDNSPATYLIKKPKFASDFVDWFIEECLLEEFVPDALIEIYDELEQQAARYGNSFPSARESDPEKIIRAFYKPTLQVCEDFLGREIDKMLRDIVLDAINSLADDQIMEKIERVDPLEEWLNRLINETIHQCCYDIVKDTAVEMADDHIEREYRNNILDDVITDYIIEIGPSLVNDSVFELLLERFIEEEVIKPEVADDSREIAKEIIQSYDNKIIKRELQAVTRQAEDKLADSLCLEYLLSTIARQGQLWTESDYASRYLDNIVVNTLIEQFLTVLHNRDKTLNNKPLKKLHQKVVTDVALDVLLQKLSSTLDEDIADVDEYERGILDDLEPPL